LVTPSLHLSAAFSLAVSSLQVVMTEPSVWSVSSCMTQTPICGTPCLPWRKPVVVLTSL
jgi:hypothetical protein